MDDSTVQPMGRFDLPWGDLEVFAHGSVPEVLRPTAAVLAQLEDRFRPALLRFHRAPERRHPYTAVWPADFQSGDLQSGDLQGVVLAEINSLECFVCAARFQAVYPDSGMPFFAHHLREHRLISGCPTCGSDFATSRIQALALIPQGR